MSAKAYWFFGRKTNIIVYVLPFSNWNQVSLKLSEYPPKQPFDNQERDFFQDGRRKFFEATEDPSSVFGKDFKGGKGGVTETIETLPDGKVVKKRVVTTYEDIEP